MRNPKAIGQMKGCAAKWGKASQAQGGAHQTEVLMDGALLDGNEFTDPSLDKAHGQQASGRRIIVK